MRPVGRIGWIQIDCPDPERLAVFWSAVLGVDVPEPKTVKNRVHLDLVVDDVNAATPRIEGERVLPHLRRTAGLMSLGRSLRCAA